MIIYIIYTFLSFKRNKKNMHLLEVYSLFFYSLSLALKAGDYFTSSDFLVFIWSG